jgi:hypothetical protein
VALGSLAFVSNVTITGCPTCSRGIAQAGSALDVDGVTIRDFALGVDIIIV